MGTAEASRSRLTRVRCSLQCKAIHNKRIRDYCDAEGLLPCGAFRISPASLDHGQDVCVTQAAGGWVEGRRVCGLLH